VPPTFFVYGDRQARDRLLRHRASLSRSDRAILRDLAVLIIEVLDQPEQLLLQQPPRSDQ
jgi:hypothetical protein